MGQGEQSRSEGHDTSGPTTDQAMTRSEEQLKVGTEQVETGRARLRKHVVTEQQTVTVPVRTNGANTMDRTTLRPRSKRPESRPSQ